MARMIRSTRIIEIRLISFFGFGLMLVASSIYPLNPQLAASLFWLGLAAQVPRLVSFSVQLKAFVSRVIRQVTALASVAVEPPSNFWEKVQSTFNLVLVHAYKTNTPVIQFRPTPDGGRVIYGEMDDSREDSFDVPSHIHARRTTSFTHNTLPKLCRGSLSRKFIQLRRQQIVGDVPLEPPSEVFPAERAPGDGKLCPCRTWRVRDCVFGFQVERREVVRFKHSVI
jgi:hypothetical protein